MRLGFTSDAVPASVIRNV